MTEFAIEARALTRLYGPLCAVREVSFSVRRGEVFGLLGPNGAGKSTVMRMTACRILPTAGELSVAGFSVMERSRHIRGLVGVVAQDNNLDRELGVLDNMLICARFFGLPRAEALRRADYLLRFVGLEARTQTRVDELSGGMKRRLMIARALLHRPQILVLDEPSAGLDPQVRHDLWHRLDELRRLMTITILLSTHYMEEAERLCDRILIIDGGRVLAVGTPRELIDSNSAGYVLEVRASETVKHRETGPNVRAFSRKGTQFYFANTPELLYPIMRDYAGCRTLIRPSNLEDAYLQMVDDSK